MKHVDALSRHPIAMVVRSKLIDRVVETQKRDERIETILKILEKESFKNFIAENGILYEVTDQGDKLLSIPKGQQKEVIKNVHDNGHFAARKMEEIIRRENSIPNLREKAENCRRNCIQCILAERKAGKHEGYLSSIELHTPDVRRYLPRYKP